MDNTNEYTIRNLKKNEIECRINSISKNGLILFLYKTARTDIKILDETVGSMNWQCDYKEIKNNIYCGISVRNPTTGEWITKWDCGSISEFGEKEKTAASDSFKRAGFKWGIGIELYTAPFIFIPDNKCNISANKCYDKFVVEKINTQNKTICGLSIRNETLNSRCFVWQRQKLAD